jgi:3,4-dihydroxy-2-butanone 4-phosphate synthase
MGISGSDRTNERIERMTGEGEKHSGSFISGGHIAIFRNEGRLSLEREGSLSF